MTAPPVNGDRRNAQKRYRDWQHSHSGKYRFTSQRQAWWRIVRIWIRARRIDDGLHPYVCRWTNDPAAGKTAGPPHIHIGHSKKYLSPSKRARRFVNTGFVWPYCRARRRVRAWRSAMGD